MKGRHQNLTFNVDVLVCYTANELPCCAWGDCVLFAQENNTSPWKMRPRNVMFNPKLYQTTSLIPLGAISLERFVVHKTQEHSYKRMGNNVEGDAIK